MQLESCVQNKTTAAAIALNRLKFVLILMIFAISITLLRMSYIIWRLWPVFSHLMLQMCGYTCT